MPDKAVNTFLTTLRASAKLGTYEDQLHSLARLGLIEYEHGSFKFAERFFSKHLELVIRDGNK